MAEQVAPEKAAEKPAPKPVKDRSGAKYVLADIASQAYADAWAAKERGEKIGWSASNFPQELATTLGVHIVYPENQAAAIGAKGGGLRMCEHAEGMGYSNDLCAYARISLAYADVKDAPELNMPQPDFVLCCNNICSCMMKWYENLAHELNIPIIFFDAPYNADDEVPESEIKYLRAQWELAIKQICEITGKKWNQRKFEDVMKVSQRSAKAWRRAASMSSYTPSPFSGFDLFNHMAVAVCARGTEEAAEGFEQLEAEYEQAVLNGTTTFKNVEKHRILFEGIACWPHLRNTYKPLKDRGINMTATIYAPAFAITYDSVDDMMRAYASVPNCISLNRATKLRADACRRGNVDGAVIHTNRSCKLWSGIMPEINRRLEAELGIPTVTFDGDQADPRNFSQAQYDTRIQGLAEIMDANKLAAAQVDPMGGDAK